MKVIVPRMDMTLAELQEMAARQQQQIEAQQQLLANKVCWNSFCICFVYVCVIYEFFKKKHDKVTFFAWILQSMYFFKSGLEFFRFF